MSARLPRALLLVTAILLVTRIGLATRERTGAARPSPVTWRSVPEALMESERTGRPLLYDFSADWCRPCRRMDREVFANEEAGRFVNAAFVPTRVEDGLDADGLTEEEAAALRERLDVQAFPTLLVVQGDAIRGRLVGYDGRDATLEFLRSTLPTPP